MTVQDAFQLRSLLEELHDEFVHVRSTPDDSLTCELTAEQLHAQGAVPPADLGVNAHVLRLHGRCEGVG